MIKLHTPSQYAFNLAHKQTHAHTHASTHPCFFNVKFTYTQHIRHTSTYVTAETVI